MSIIFLIYVIGAIRSRTGEQFTSMISALVLLSLNAPIRSREEKSAYGLVWVYMDGMG